MCVELSRAIPTGCKTIDKLLGGGLPPETLSLVYGEAETGKTTLAMQCAVNCAKQGHKTLFVDCDGSFSPERLSQVASGDFDKVAEMIILIKPTSFREQAAFVDQIDDYVTANVALVVFDTVTSLYRVRVAESPSGTFKLNRELNRQLAVLAQTTRTRKITILMTSQVHAVFDEMPIDSEPVATRVLKFWADTIIAMKPTETPQNIRMVLEKGPNKTQPVNCNARIQETGIHDLAPR